MATASVAPEPSARPLRGVRWYVCGLLFFVTAINYVDRVSLGAMNERVLKPALGWDDADPHQARFGPSRSSVSSRCFTACSSSCRRAVSRMLSCSRCAR